MCMRDYIRGNMPLVQFLLEVYLLTLTSDLAMEHDPSI